MDTPQAVVVVVYVVGVDRLFVRVHEQKKNTRTHTRRKEYNKQLRIGLFLVDTRRKRIDSVSKTNERAMVPHPPVAGVHTQQNP